VTSNDFELAERLADQSEEDPHASYLLVQLLDDPGRLVFEALTAARGGGGHRHHHLHLERR
jgi:hypothetical protein